MLSSKLSQLTISPPVIAHRGASAYAPENTIASFLKAKKLGANWVEMDVMLTACGEVVVIHDETLERTTNGKGKVSDYSYAELKKLDAGAWFNADFKNEKIPLLKEVLSILAQQKLAASIEIKTMPGTEEFAVKQILTVIHENHFVEKIPLLISSFSLPILQCVKKYSPSSNLGFLMNDWKSDWEKICDDLNCVSIGFNQQNLDAEKIKMLTKTGRRVLSYTVNDPSLARELFALGVHAVFTDCPDKILLALGLSK